MKCKRRGQPVAAMECRHRGAQEVNGAKRADLLDTVLGPGDQRAPAGVRWQPEESGIKRADAARRRVAGVREVWRRQALARAQAEQRRGRTARRAAAEREVVQQRAACADERTPRRMANRLKRRDDGEGDREGDAATQLGVPRSQWTTNSSACVSIGSSTIAAIAASAARPAGRPGSSRRRSRKWRAETPTR